MFLLKMFYLYPYHDIFHRFENHGYNVLLLYHVYVLLLNLVVGIHAQNTYYNLLSSYRDRPKHLYTFAFFVLHSRYQNPFYIIKTMNKRIKIDLISLFYNRVVQSSITLSIIIISLY